MLSRFASRIALHRASLPIALLASVGCSGSSSDAAPTTFQSSSNATAAGATADITFLRLQNYASVTSSNSAVVFISDYSFDTVIYLAGVPGTATITVVGQADPTTHVVPPPEVATINVAATSTIAIDPAIPSPLTVLAGEPYNLHATAFDANGNALNGVGAIHFSYGGAVASAGPGSCHVGGDCGTFVLAKQGMGTVTMTAAPSATTSLVLYSVAAIDTFAFSRSTVDVAVQGSFASVGMTIMNGSLFISAEPVCTAADATIVSFANAWFGDLGPPGGSLLVWGTRQGSTSITCTIGGQSETLDVNVY